ncbi:N-6 DNA methylase [Amniculibacterium sp. G2-70]|uniref:N-6 DNA methylase n=1 Tax=Amniculibacterium sp. G2-70 TaxID=2767188 RepID=UPI001653F9E8|nr:N-6 DNA methylase [Amniculibacterium sp. G2-70]
MSEELIQRGLTKSGLPFGKYELFNIGGTNILNLVKYKIISQKDYLEYSQKQPDIIIVDRRNKKNIQVIAVIEFKNISELDNDRKIKKALEQCNNYCEVVHSKIGIVTNGINFFWINPQTKIENSEYVYLDKKSNKKRGFSFIKDEKDNKLNAIFDQNSIDSIELIELIFSTISSENNNLIKGSLISPALLAKKVWQSVWLATGDDPKKCLMTFTELFIFKFLSDLGILTVNDDGIPIDFKTVYSRGNLTCLKYYLSSVRPHIKKMFPASETDPTTIINGLSLKKGQNQDELFFDILKSFEEYGELKNIDPSFKSRLFEDFLKGTTGKKQLAQFFTPRNVIKAIVEMADVKNLPEDAKILDPSGGVGGFIIESILNRIINNKKDFHFDSTELTSKINYLAYDFDEITIILAKANLLLCLTEILEKNPTLTEELSKLLHKTFRLTNKQIIGSLENRNENEFDLIMSNPPYVSKGLALYKKYIKDNGLLNSYYNISSVGKEGLFIQKIIRELKPNNRSKAFIVLPNGFFYRPADNDLKKYLIENCYIDCIISLPEKTFYATNKKTYILGITKKEDKQLKQSHKVLCGLVQSIGEELSKDRIPIKENDLIPFVSNYKQFSADKDNYKPLSKTIKAIDFINFENNFNWLIENYWSKEEKIEIGIEDSDRNINDEDLFDNIEYFKSNLQSIKEQLENRFTKISNNYKYLETDLFNEDIFKLNTGMLGLNRKEYTSIDTENKNDYPIYTATINPVAYIKKDKKLKPHIIKNDNFHISFASDGDGTAGKNIVLHNKDYYINTSRISFEIINEKVLPKYIYYFIQDIKKKYGYDFKHKANLNNIKEISISIPLNENGEFDIDAQKLFIEEYEGLKNLKQNLMNDFFKKISMFRDDIDNQLDIKFKEYFNI